MAKPIYVGRAPRAAPPGLSRSHPTTSSRVPADRHGSGRRQNIPCITSPMATTTTTTSTAVNLRSSASEMTLPNARGRSIHEAATTFARSKSERGHADQRYLDADAWQPACRGSCAGCRRAELNSAGVHPQQRKHHGHVTGCQSATNSPRRSPIVRRDAKVCPKSPSAAWKVSLQRSFGFQPPTHSQRRSSQPAPDEISALSSSSRASRRKVAKAISTDMPMPVMTSLHGVLHAALSESHVTASSSRESNDIAVCAGPEQSRHANPADSEQDSFGESPLTQSRSACQVQFSSGEADAAEKSRGERVRMLRHSTEDSGEAGDEDDDDDDDDEDDDNDEDTDSGADEEENGAVGVAHSSHAFIPHMRQRLSAKRPGALSQSLKKSIQRSLKRFQEVL